MFISLNSIIRILIALNHVIWPFSYFPSVIIAVVLLNFAFIDKFTGINDDVTFFKVLVSLVFLFLTFSLYLIRNLVLLVGFYIVCEKFLQKWKFRLRLFEPNDSWIVQAEAMVLIWLQCLVTRALVVIQKALHAGYSIK